MFDELKEVMYFKEITDLKGLNDVKYFKEIKRLRSLLRAETYLESKQASTMELFLWIYFTVYYFRNINSIIVVWLISL